jgi:hypothetical protein
MFERMMLQAAFSPHVVYLVSDRFDHRRFMHITAGVEQVATEDDRVPLNHVGDLENR